MKARTEITITVAKVEGPRAGGRLDLTIETDLAPEQLLDAIGEAAQQAAQAAGAEAA